MANSEDRNRELFEQFKALHAQSQSEEGTGDPGLDTLLRTVEPSFADLILSLAVPHWFNEEVVASIVEADSPDYPSKLLKEILSLSFIRSHHEGYAYHDVARDNLRRYLARKDPDHVRELSRRFADAFTQEDHPVRKPRRSEPMRYEEHRLISRQLQELAIDLHFGQGVQRRSRLVQNQ